MELSPTEHVPVMPDEIVTALQPRAGSVLVDGTLGGGGHTRLLAQAVGPQGRVIAVDRDPAAIARAEQSLAGLPVAVAHANYNELPEVLAELGIERVDGIVLDLGFSSDQLSDLDRGFSYHSTGPLDLRYDTTRGEPAWRLVNRLSAEHLAQVLYEFGEERFSRRIARNIVERRRDQPITSASELAHLVRRSIPNAAAQSIDGATRTFQALRIAVNDELRWLKLALNRLPDLLAPQGRLAIISFHSLEDRIVKDAFRGDARLNVVTKKPLRPTDAETASNPRSRSAKLRVAERRA